MNRFKYIIIIVFLIITYLSNLHAAENDFSPEKAIIKGFSKILTDNNWRITEEKNTLFAYKFGKILDKFSFSISRTNDIISIETNKNGFIEKKEFNYDSSISPETFIKQKAIPFLTKNLLNNSGEKTKNIAETVVGFGYNRTHNKNNDFLPAASQGGLFLSAKMTYDPSKYIDKNLVLKGMDYSYFNGNMVVQKIDGKYEIMENEIICYLSLYASNKAKTDHDSKIKNRSINGIFTGMDYFRPGYGDPAVRWQEDVYTEQPHIQYVTYKPAMWFYKYFRENLATGSSFNFTFMTGPAFGINSSITMVDVSEEMEDSRNSIFKSMNHKKQNFFYSLSCPVSVSFDMLYWNRLKFGLQQDYYYFIAAEAPGDAYEMLSRSYIKTGFYFRKDICLEANYERWYVKGKIKDKDNPDQTSTNIGTREKSETWNRIILSLKFYY